MMFKDEADFEKVVGRLNIDSEPNPAHREKLRRQMLSVFNQAEQKPETRTIVFRTLRRITMKSTATKIAAVAVIAIAFISIMYLCNGTVDLTSTALAQMTESMKKMPWLHAIVEGTYSGKQDRLEGWISFEAQISANKWASGKVLYNRKNIHHKFDPELQTITISYVPNDEIEKVGSVWDYWETMMEIFKKAGAEISQEKSRYEGSETIVFKISSSAFGTPMEIQLTVDAEKNLPVYLNQKAFDANGDLTVEANAYFDYPESGPTDIYELGVSRSAKVVNNLPNKKVSKILEIYRSHRESAPARYIALVTESWLDEKLDTFLTYGISLIHRNDKTQRIDDFRLPEMRQKDWRQSMLAFKREMGSTFESLLDWWKENGEIRNMNLYDGKFQYVVSRKDDKWVAQPRTYNPTGDLRGDNDLADFGWGAHFFWPRQGSGPSTVIEDDYSRKNNLMCLETKCQGAVSDTGWAILPERIVCYLNPQRDFICQRFEEHKVLDAPWQKDKSWLEAADPNRISTEETEIWETTEFAQTDKGQWYPKVMEKKYKRGGNNRNISRKTVFLKIDIEFPKDIFNPESLPEENK